MSTKMSIAALDKNTAKQLSTAQIITSVFSVVKELVENALDADANSVEINLFEKGLNLIEVKDNGQGITKPDSAYMGLPSYTSKISKFTDLESLEYYGFRGEALNAMCRVSDVKIITRTQEDDAARCYTMNFNGSIQKAEFCCRTIGTTVQVHSLFKNIPVRRQIINNPKRASQDLKLIENLLKDFGICRPHVRIIFRIENSTIFTKAPGATIKESLTNIYGKKTILLYEFIDYKIPECAIDLIIPKKNTEDISTICQTNFEHIFVNNRPVKFKEYEKAIVRVLSEHFDGKLQGRKKPMFFLLISVPPSDIDVNLEPNKTTVLLKNNSQILEEVNKLLVEYYQINLSPDNSQEIPMNLNTSLPAYQDFSFGDDDKDEGNKEPVIKKRKVDKENPRNSAGKSKSNLKEHDKENKLPSTSINDHVKTSALSLFKNANNNNCDVELMEQEETLSQLPKVGEDFSTQEIQRAISSNTPEIEAVKSAVEELNTSLKKSDKKLEKIVETSSEDSETISQLPKINVGDDFSTQEIQRVLSHSSSKLKPDEFVVNVNENLDLNSNRAPVESITNALKSLDSSLDEPRDEEDKNDQNKTDVNIQNLNNVEITQLQWSRGHHPLGLTGNVGVKICSPTNSVLAVEEKKDSPVAKVLEDSPVRSETQKKTVGDPKARTPQTYAVHNSRGFLYFSKEFRPKLMKRNPGMNLVEIAKQITTTWKNMSSEEREKYRVLGMNDKSLDPGQYLTPPTPKIPKTSAKNSQMNRTRLVGLIDNMKNPKTDRDSSKSSSTRLIRTLVNFQISIDDVSRKMNKVSKECQVFRDVVGSIDDDTWLIRTKSQIWVLSATRLFDTLKLDTVERSKNKGNSDFIDFCLKRCFRETENLDFMQLVCNYNS